MTEILSLAKLRKARLRQAKKQKADENAVKFGRTKAEKKRDKTTGQRAKSKLDGHLRDG